MKKVKEFLKEFGEACLDSFKEDWKFYVILISITLICFIPVDYYIVVGGGINDVSSRIEVEDASKSKGSYNLSYVRQLKGNFLTFGLSYIIPGWDRIETGDYKYDDTESVEDIEFRSDIDLKNANSLAIINAYKYAKKDVSIKSGHFYVIFVTNDYDTEFKIKDNIISINGVKLKEVNDFRNSLSTCEVGSKVDVEIIRDKKEMTISSTVYELAGNKILGVGLNYYYDLEMNPKTEIKFKKRERGPSAGLVTTLSIYDKLVSEDLTHGLKIAGTGTIEADSSIGEIGGVKYKVMGADAGGADVFLVPKNNLEEALKVKKEKKLKIKVYGVATFKDAIEVLREL